MRYVGPRRRFARLAGRECQRHPYSGIAVLSFVIWCEAPFHSECPGVVSNDRRLMAILRMVVRVIWYYDGSLHLAVVAFNVQLGI